MRDLARKLVESPAESFARLAQASLDLCEAGSAGVSLLETTEGDDVLRWVGLAGELEGLTESTLPRRRAPWAACLDGASPAFLRHPGGFTAAPSEGPPIEEALVFPFAAPTGSARGAIVVFLHDPGRCFDGEDVLLLAELEPFATSALLAFENERRVLELEQALAHAERCQNEVLATLAHELRNPLGAILAAAELIRRRERVGEPAGSACSIVERQTAHMGRMVDDLLDAYRLRRDKVELRLEDVALDLVVSHAVETARPRIDQRQHRLVVELPQKPIIVRGDASRLMQVIANLVGNAVKYTDPGGTIALSAETEGPEMVLRIRDTGTGIAPEMLPRIFDLFVQDPAESVRGGLGIGLAVAKKLVELHGGTLSASSEGRSRGSEFVVRLPLREGTH